MTTPTATIREEDGALIFDFGGGISIEARRMMRTLSGVRADIRVLDLGLEREPLVGLATLALDNIRERRDFLATIVHRDGKVPDWDARLLLIADHLTRHVDEAGAEAPSFTTMPLTAFMSAEWEAGEPIIEDIISTGETVFLYGQVGHGKTLAGAELAISTAAGRCAFQRFAARQGPVLFVEEDQHPHKLQTYLRMLLDAYRLDPADLPLHIWERQFLRLDDDAAAEAFTDKVLELRPLLVVLDAFIDIHSGDGFAGRELRPVLDRIVALPQLLPCAVLVIDHPRKEASGAKQQQDPIDALYGGRIKSAQADTMIFVKRTSESPSRFQFNFVKTRSEARAPFNATLSAEQGFFVDDTHIGITPGANTVLQWARGLAAGSRFTKEDIRAATRLSPRSVDAALRELTFNRQVEEAGKVGRAKAFRITTIDDSEKARPQRPLSEMAPGGIHQDSGGVD